MENLCRAAIFCAALTACGTSAVPNALQAGSRFAPVIRHGGGSGYAVIFAFNGTDGAMPIGTLLFYNSALYGTTYAGGSTNNGTVFVAKTGGKERVLHSFARRSDGHSPDGGLTLLDGVFYGTTSSGGKYGRGTVFSITPSGQEKVLHSFSGKNGRFPRGDLTVLNGTLYGTTFYGGTHDVGTVFSITRSGSEHVLHSFTNSATDGGNPIGGLVAVRGTLYGTTLQGGSCTYGVGTAYAISTTGKERVLYNFGCTRTDGATPEGGLIAVKNVLYGTTFYGGYPSGYEGGTVFRLTLAGIEKVLYSFGSQSVGVNPDTALTSINGTLYGCTYAGGTNNFGTIYSVDASGSEQVLHSFGPSPDGEKPSSSLLIVNGTLYGTTAAGGGSASAGTIFKISP